jgi:hypothetical protein
MIIRSGALSPGASLTRVLLGATVCRSRHGKHAEQNLYTPSTCTRGPEGGSYGSRAYTVLWTRCP